MDQRKTPLIVGEYYHVFNRGVARAPTFLTKSDYNQAVNSLSYYSNINPPMKFSRLKDLSLDVRDDLFKKISGNEKLIEIVCYCFLPNHFHLLLKQLSENGISTFLSRFANSYTKYFNTKNKRVGPLFQGKFKSVHLETEDQLIHLSRYIHLNPLSSFVVSEKDFLEYPWSSLKAFLKKDKTFVKPEIVLKNFSSITKYMEFISNQIDYQRKLVKIRHLVIEA